MTLTSTGAPRYPSPQIITLPGRTAVSTTLSAKAIKPSLTVVDARNQQPARNQPGIQSDGGKPLEPVKLGPGQTQISFQVPLNWNSQGTKSLLDNSKTVSLVSLNPADTSTRSLLPSNESLTSQSGSANTCISKMTLSGATNSVSKAYITGNSKVFSNLGTAPVLAQTTTGLISVSKPGPSIARIAKGSSFMISNKQYTIVPSNSAPVVTQLVKTEKLNKGKVTMAEAQIMLPTGPAKISWPLQSQTSTADSKHILITTPVSKTSQQVGGKSPNTKTQLLVTASDSNGKSSNNSSAIPTAKVVEVGSPNKIIMAPGNQASGQKSVPIKTSIIPAQKSWELVKQSSQLIPQKLGKSSHTGGSADKPGNSEEMQTELKSSTDTRSQKSNDKTESGVKTGEDVEQAATKSEQEEVNNKKNQRSNSDSSVRPDDKENADDIEQKQSDDSNDSVEVKLENLKGMNEDMEVDDVGVDTGKDENGKEDGTEKKEDFNPVDAMTWKNGVGELPGSNLKVGHLLLTNINIVQS